MEGDFVTCAARHVTYDLSVKELKEGSMPR